MARAVLRVYGRSLATSHARRCQCVRARRICTDTLTYKPCSGRMFEDIVLLCFYFAAELLDTKIFKTFTTW